MQFIYLHGFTSSAKSNKALFFKAKFKRIGVNLIIPDLNLDNFTDITLTKQLIYIKKIIIPNQPVVFIGSSMGGLTSLILAGQIAETVALILLAPALNLADIFVRLIGIEALIKWQKDGFTYVHHYGNNNEVKLNYEFIVDLKKYSVSTFNLPIPMKIFHGINDAVIPIKFISNFSEHKANVDFQQLDSDHSLEDKLEVIWLATYQFLLKANYVK